MHSQEQMRASCESGGNALLQCSQVGLSSSMRSSMCSYQKWAINGSWNLF